MASIEDLKTSDSYTGTGVASGDIKNDVLEIANPNVSRSRVNTASIASPGTNKNSATNSMPRKVKHERKIADLSTLPKNDILLEDVKVSIEDEVFKEGGPFEEYKNKKLQEMKEINDLIDEHNAMIAAERGEEVPTDEELEKMAEEGKATNNLTEVIRGTKYYDEADAYGRAVGAIKTAPLDEGLVANPQITKEELEQLDATPENEKKDSTEEVDELDEFEKEMEDMDGQIGLLNEPDENIRLEGHQDQEEAPAVLPTDGLAEVRYDVERNEEGGLDMHKKVINSNKELVSDDIVKEEAPKADPTPEPVKEEPKPAPAPTPTKNPEQPKVEVNTKKETNTVSTPSSKDVTDSLKRLSEQDKIDVNIDEEFDEDANDDENMGTATVTVEVDPDENMKEFQASVSEKIHTVNKKLNLSSFKVINSPVSISKASLEPDHSTAMSWALPCTGQHISMREWGGKELEKLGENYGANNFQILKNRYKMIYDHITSPKPDDFEMWLKTISFQDDDHLYFTIYGASFGGSNFIPYDCPQCKNTFLSDNIPLENMYKFKDDKAKDKFMKLKNTQDDGSKPGLYTTEVVQLSDKFAIGFRDPSLWNVIFEPSLLDEKFLQKYSDIVTIIGYIDNIYLIGDGTLQPIGYKIDKNNAAKTIKARIFTYSKILSSLSSDQYYTIMAYLTQINTIGEGITFIQPEVTCPKCGTVIPEREMRASDILFSRSQLATLSLTSLS